MAVHVNIKHAAAGTIPNGKYSATEMKNTPGLKEKCIKYTKRIFAAQRGHHSLDLLRIAGNGRRGHYFFFF